MKKNEKNNFSLLPSQIILHILIFLKNPKYYAYLSRLNRNTYKKLLKNEKNGNGMYWIDIYRRLLPDELENNKFLMNPKLLVKNCLIDFLKKCENFNKTQKMIMRWIFFDDLNAIKDEEWNPQFDLFSKKNFIAYDNYEMNALTLANYLHRTDILNHIYLRATIENPSYNKNSRLNNVGTWGQMHWAAACGINVKWDHEIYFAKTEYYITPLMLGCYLGNYEVVASLLESGITPQDASPICLATACGHEEIVKLLLQNKIHVQTAMIDAVKFSRFRILDILLDTGFVDINKIWTDADYYDTALIRSPTFIQRLLVVNLREYTVLSIACIERNLRMVKKLISRGADVNKIHNSHLTLLMLLENDRYENIVKELLKAGANIDATDEAGRSVLYRAADSANFKVASLLKFWQIKLSKKGTLIDKIIAVLKFPGMLDQQIMNFKNRFLNENHLKVNSLIVELAKSDPNNIDDIAYLLNEYVKFIPQNKYKFIFECILSSNIYEAQESKTNYLNKN